MKNFIIKKLSEIKHENLIEFYSKVFRALFRMTNKLVDKHLAISKRIFDELIKNYSIDKNKIEYVINSSDYLKNIKTNYKPREDGYLSFVSIGTLSKRKNYEALINVSKFGQFYS